MLDPGTLAFVFESGVVRFDDDGVLYVHVPHGAGDPHPLLVHGLDDEGAMPEEVAEAVLTGTDGEAAWRPRANLPETDELPEGLVLRFEGWDWAQVEMSGDLTISLRGVDGLPDWVRPEHVHRLARPGGRVQIWKDSAPPPAITRQEQSALEDPMKDWEAEHARPPQPTGRWVGAHQAAPGCTASMLLLGLAATSAVFLMA